MGGKHGPVIERLERKTCKLSCGCWIWCGTVDKNGYGYIKAGGDTKLNRLVHCVSYEHYKGAVPVGLEIDHLCRNPSCVNPDHLEAVTHQVNMSRGHNAIKTHCPHGHEYSARNTLYQPNGGRLCRLCRNETVRKRRAKIRSRLLG